MIEEKLKFRKSFLYLVIVFSFLFRVTSIYYFKENHVDLDLSSMRVNEWNILLQNLINYQSYSFFIFNEIPVPSAYMPPAYPFFLYLVGIVTPFTGINFIYTIIFIQIVISTYSVYLFFQINQNFFSDKISLINSSIFSIIPINIYMCGQISSINLQIFFSLLFLKFLFDQRVKKNIIFLSLICGLLILTRAEFILIFIIIIIFGTIQKKITIKDLVKIILIVSLVVSPYAIRNYIHFNQIFIVKSLGFNLWKGNNPSSLVQGYDNYENNSFSELYAKLNNVKKDKYYEINRDKVFLEEAKKNLIKDPLNYFNLFVTKIFSFYFIDFNSNYPNYYNFLSIFPNILFSILSFFGLFIFFNKKNINKNYLLLYLFLNLIIFSIFFILPRYKLIILPIQIMLSTNFILYFLKKLKKINSKNKA